MHCLKRQHSGCLFFARYGNSTIKTPLLAQPQENKVFQAHRFFFFAKELKAKTNLFPKEIPVHGDVFRIEVF